MHVRCLCLIPAERKRTQAGTEEGLDLVERRRMAQRYELAEWRDRPITQATGTL
jgi:hypothetical protein